ncbi:2-hydroxychromene-2-carboxylate isomerase [Xanthobacter oligotrophicus]|uniref:2-hydroxychromene-2-carboxylate isomerase n=1 Tax=Xanthobacter oligotrophicus TaxID=2607286 RepID=A0ABW6ZUZ4_9HYPH
MSGPKRKVEYYFSFISLWSYVGSLAFHDLVKRHDIEVDYKPIDLLAVFASGGGKPVKQRPLQRQAYRIVEMKRWRDIRGIPLVIHPKFYPADPARGHRLFLAAQEVVKAGRAGDLATFAHLGLKAVWADELNVEDPDTLVGLADRAGFDGRALLAAADDKAHADRAAAFTKEAIDRDLFGAPFYFYNGEPFWGQDRLDLLDATIASGRPPVPPTSPSEL